MQQHSKHTTTKVTGKDIKSLIKIRNFKMIDLSQLHDDCTQLLLLVVAEYVTIFT